VKTKTSAKPEVLLGRVKTKTSAKPKVLLRRVKTKTFAKPQLLLRRIKTKTSAKPEVLLRLFKAHAESPGFFFSSWQADIRNSNSFAPLQASDDISTLKCTGNNLLNNLQV
jgi:hypothetical protein